MSKRSITDKKIKRLRKLTANKLPAHIDLVMWLTDRRHAKTPGEARRFLEDGRVRAGDHVVGRMQVMVYDEKSKQPVQRWVASPVVPADLREDLVFE